MNARTLIQITLASFLALVLSQVAVAGEAPGKGGRAGHLKVMTQNLYVGADLFKILNPDQPVPVNAAEIFSDIQMTDFMQRAESIADLVAEHEPHLIGLQEVSLIRTQCPDDIILPPNDPTPNATDVYADYLQILMDELAERGLFYEVVAQITNADVELPVLNLGLLDCPFELFDARLTDHDVTLKRHDVDVTFSYSNNYQANFPVPTPAGPIEFIRGFNIVDVDLNGRDYRFVNTHLEVNGNPFANFFQFAQATELTQTLDALAAGLSDEIVVVVGDLNSDPADGPIAICVFPPFFDTPGPCPTPYAVMISGGYTDTWTERNGAPDDGFTCCQQDLLMNPVSWLDQRIDHVMVRPPLSGAQGPHFLNAVHSTVVGNRQFDRTVDGLWPSDHAGVVTGMTFRQKK